MVLEDRGIAWMGLVSFLVVRFALPSFHDLSSSSVLFMVGWFHHIHRFVQQNVRLTRFAVFEIVREFAGSSG